MSETPHQQAAPKTAEFTILGETYLGGELNALDIIDVEELTGYSIGELAADPAKRGRMKVALAMLWVVVRKSRLTPAQITAKQWAISFDKLGEIAIPDLKTLGVRRRIFSLSLSRAGPRPNHRLRHPKARVQLLRGHRRPDSRSPSPHRRRKTDFGGSR